VLQWLLGSPLQSDQSREIYRPFSHLQVGEVRSFLSKPMSERAHPSPSKMRMSVYRQAVFLPKLPGSRDWRVVANG